MNKNRIDEFLMSLETNGILSEAQQSVVLQQELDELGCGENGKCTNSSMSTCGTEATFNTNCSNATTACAGGSNYICDNSIKTGTSQPDKAGTTVSSGTAGPH